jgi:hypothetical protein
LRLRTRRCSSARSSRANVSATAIELQQRIIDGMTNYELKARVAELTALSPTGVLAELESTVSG